MSSKLSTAPKRLRRFCGKLYTPGIPTATEQGEEVRGGSAERLALYAGDDIEFVVSLERRQLGQS